MIPPPRSSDEPDVGERDGGDGKFKICGGADEGLGGTVGGHGRRRFGNGAGGRGADCRRDEGRMDGGGGGGLFGRCS